MFKRYKLFTIYTPTVFSFLCLIFIAVALSGQTNNSRSATYALKVEFKDLVKSNVIHPTNFTLYQNFYLDKVYYIGIWGYCSTDYPGSDTDWLSCTKADAPPYVFDPYELISKEGFSWKYRKFIDYVLLPDGVTMNKADVSAVFALLWVSLGISAASLLYYFSVGGYHVHKPHDFVVYPGLIINIICLTTIGGVSTAKFNKIAKSFNSTNGVFGISASFGNGQFYKLIWVSLGFQVVSLLMTIISNYFLLRDPDYKDAMLKFKQDEESGRARSSTRETRTRPRSPSPTPSVLLERHAVMERGRESSFERGRSSVRMLPAPPTRGRAVERREDNDNEIGEAPPRYEDINKDQYHPRSGLPDYTGSLRSTSAPNSSSSSNNQETNNNTETNNQESTVRS